MKQAVWANHVQRESFQRPAPAFSVNYTVGALHARIKHQADDCDIAGVDADSKTPAAAVEPIEKVPVVSTRRPSLGTTVTATPCVYVEPAHTAPRRFSSPGTAHDVEWAANPACWIDAFQLKRSSARCWRAMEDAHRIPCSSTSARQLPNPPPWMCTATAHALSHDLDWFSIESPALNDL